MSGGDRLSRIQIDILSLLVESPRSGADVLSALRDQYPDSPPRSTVYHNIGVLADGGLIDRNGAQDGRKHQYAPTEAGERAVREYVGTLVVRVQVGE